MAQEPKRAPHLLSHQEDRLWKWVGRYVQPRVDRRKRGWIWEQSYNPIVRAEQRVAQEGQSPSGARMRGAISKSGGNSSLAGEGGRYGEAYTGTKAKAGYSQGEPEAISCKSPEGRVSTVRGIRRACGEVPGRSRWGNPRRTGRPKAGEGRARICVAKAF